MAFRLYGSTDLEDLAHALAPRLMERGRVSRLANPPRVVVQSAGLQRWLALKVAEREGICAHVAFDFPGTFFARCMGSLSGRGTAPEADPFDEQILRWRIYRLLPALLKSCGAEAVSQYLGRSSPDPVRRQQLANRLASLLDRYQLARPDWLLAWNRGESLLDAPHEGWQRDLWALLVQDAATPSTAESFELALTQLRQGAVPDGLPAAVHFFGFSSMSPRHTEFLQALSKHIEIHFYALRPCRAYDRLRPAQLAAEAGLWDAQPLLQSLGRQGREFHARLKRIADTSQTLDAPPPVPATLLTDLQESIRSGIWPDEPWALKREDRSIEFHACYSPMREIEALRDWLLARFSEQPDLQPHEILVLSPDIQTYAPYVQAVFGSGSERDADWIPWSLADRSIGSENPEAAVFLRLLDLLRGRLEFSQVMELFSEPVVACSFGCAPEDAARVGAWLDEAGARWGVDSDERMRCSGVAFAEGSWEWARRRLLLGLAMQPMADDDALVETPSSAGPDAEPHRVAPVDSVEGADALLLGRFLHFLDELIAARAVVFDSQGQQIPLPAREWRPWLSALLETFFASGACPAAGRTALTNAIVSLESALLVAGCQDEPLPLDVIESALREQLEQETGAGGFLNGGVTFCQFQPMRNVPARIICLLGMNDGAFPRQDARLGFDLLPLAPRPGDPSRRQDDRTIFLEILLAARERLRISWIGRDPHSNESRPPSVLLAELRDLLDRRTATAEHAAASRRLTVDHPLQPFHPVHFSDESGPLASFSRENLAVARSLCAPPTPSSPCRCAPAREEMRQRLTLRELVSFLKNPSRYFLQERVGLLLRGRQTEPSGDDETLEIDSLARTLLGGEMLEGQTETLRDPERIERFRALFAARGALPAGPWRDTAFAGLCEQVNAVAETVQTLTADWMPREPQTGELSFADVGGPITLVVDLPRLYQTPEGGVAQAFYRCTTPKGKDLLQAWTCHLALQALHDRPVVTILTGTDGKPIVWQGADSLDCLNGLVLLRQEGLSRALPLFQEESLLYATLCRDKGPEEALARAIRNWDREVDWSNNPVRKDPWERYAWSRFPEGDDREEFQRLSMTVYGPLLEARNHGR